MKATQLEQLNVDYQLILEQRDIMSTSLERKKEGLPGLEKEVVHWEEKFKNLTQLDRLAESKQELEHEIAWAQVIGLERERDKIARDIVKKERSVPKFTDKVEQCKVWMMDACLLGKRSHVTFLSWCLFMFCFDCDRLK